MTTQTPVFSAFNVHAESCGTPPDIRSSADCYFGYFENQYGEQWVLKFDPKSSRGELRGGDIDWGKVVEFDVAREDWPLRLPVMNPPEWEWLMTCLHAAMGGRVVIDRDRLVEILKERFKKRGRQESEDTPPDGD